MRQHRRITAHLGGALALIVVAFLATVTLAPAALADSTAASAAPASAPGTHAPVHTDSVTDCTDILETFGYTLTIARLSACGAAALGLPSNDKAIAACVAVLVGTGVGPVVSSIACAAGTFG